MFVDDFSTIYIENIIVNFSTADERSSAINAESGNITIIGTDYCYFGNLVFL